MRVLRHIPAGDTMQVFATVWFRDMNPYRMTTTSIILKVFHHLHGGDVEHDGPEAVLEWLQSDRSLCSQGVDQGYFPPRWLPLGFPGPRVRRFGDGKSGFRVWYRIATLFSAWFLV